jgi:hypothetical protein
LLAPPATALGRVGVPDDIGPVIASLVSDDNHWVTGQRIEASGGIAVASLIERFPDATSDILSAWTGAWWRDIANGERLDNKRRVTRDVPDCSSLSRVPVQAKRQRAHHKGFVLLRRFSQTTTPFLSRNRSRCWRAGCSSRAERSSDVQVEKTDDSSCSDTGLAS